MENGNNTSAKTDLRSDSPAISFKPMLCSRSFCLSENKNQYIDAGGTTKGWYEAMKQAMKDISLEQKDIFADINNRGYIPSTVHLRMRPKTFYEECLPKIQLIRL